MKCYKCGKEMDDSGRGSVAGLNITFFMHSEDGWSDGYLEKQIGKYKDDVINGGINFCYECWIDSIMGG